MSTYYVSGMMLSLEILRWASNVSGYLLPPLSDELHLKQLVNVQCVM